MRRIYGNDLMDSSDDGVETDGGCANVRVWGNRITNAANNVFTFQPISRGPWFCPQPGLDHAGQDLEVRGEHGKKTNVDDRFVVLHNTFVFPHTPSEFAQCLLNAYSRNNLYIDPGDDSYVIPGGLESQGRPGKDLRSGLDDGCGLRRIGLGRQIHTVRVGWQGLRRLGRFREGGAHREMVAFAL